MPNFATDFIPKISSVTPTDAQLADQGYTYNQAGFTYNQPGVMYGGVYNTNEYILPEISFAFSPVPTIAGYADIYTNNIPPPSNNQRIIGPGFFMFISQ